MFILRDCPGRLRRCSRTKACFHFTNKYNVSDLPFFQLCYCQLCYIGPFEVVYPTQDTEAIVVFDECSGVLQLDMFLHRLTARLWSMPIGTSSTVLLTFLSDE